LPQPPLAERLEALYRQWHHARFLGTDPLVLVRGQTSVADREIAALLASCLALGRASAIVQAAGQVLAVLLSMGSGLADAVRSAPPGFWDRPLKGFRYRFFSGAQVAALLDTTGELLRLHGSLEGVWRDLDPGLAGWDRLRAFSSRWTATGADLGMLFPVGGSTGAFKRLNLFLRWLVRADDLDPGGWSCLTPAQLSMPVDTHVLQWARREGLTRRNTADRAACEQITRALRELCPEDPLRWDFAITRQGMADKKTLAKF